MPECIFFHALCQVHLRLEKKITKGLNSLEMINCLKADNACYFCITYNWYMEQLNERGEGGEENHFLFRICKSSFKRQLFKSTAHESSGTEGIRNAASCS